MSSRALSGDQFSKVPAHLSERWGQDIGMVSPAAVSRVAFQPLRPDVDVSALAQELLSDGFRNPLHVEYNHKTGRAHLGEGNHRLAAAIQAGIPLVPVVVHRSNLHADFGDAPVTESADFPRKPDGYVKGDFHPRHIGLV